MTYIHLADTFVAGSAANTSPALAEPHRSGESGIQRIIWQNEQPYIQKILFRYLLAGAYPSHMSNVPNLRRSTRVPMKVDIEVEDCAEPLRCEGVTVVVNLHRALISTGLALSVGMNISIHVLLTDKRAKGRVVYVDPANALRCGVELEQPSNIWGIPLHPQDWDDRGHQVEP